MINDSLDVIDTLHIHHIPEGCGNGTSFRRPLCGSGSMLRGFDTLGHLEKAGPQPASTSQGKADAEVGRCERMDVN